MSEVGLSSMMGFHFMTSEFQENTHNVNSYIYVFIKNTNKYN